MMGYHRQYPQYNFAKHKGYATSEHIEAIRKFGCCEIHRATFRRVIDTWEGLKAMVDDGE